MGMPDRLPRERDAATPLSVFVMSSWRIVLLRPDGSVSYAVRWTDSPLHWRETCEQEHTQKLLAQSLIRSITLDD